MRESVDTVAEEPQEIGRRTSGTMRRSTFRAEETPTLLVVENDARTAQALRAALRELPLEILHTTTLREAVDVIRSRSGALAAGMIDVKLPDGTGLDAVRELRQAASDALILVLTDDAEPDTVNAANLETAVLAVKPCPAENLVAFAKRVVSNGHRRKREALARVDALAREVGMSPREREALSLLVTGVPRCCLASRMGIAETTLKTHIKELLRKSGRYYELSELALAILTR